MSYHVAMGAGLPPNIPQFAFPGGLPGPVPAHRGTGPIGPTMGASIFPTTLRAGGVANVTGPFAGLVQGQVRVKFEGSRWLSPSMQGPYSASVVVPPSARTGLCEIEINGRRVFGANCVIEGDAQPRGRHHGIYTRRQWTQRGQLLGLVDASAPMLLAGAAAVAVGYLLWRRSKRR